jgi:branched-chain amino acid transport system permease protein
VVGLALGFPALRVQTIYLAFATLGFNTAIWLVMRNEEKLTGGTFGINNIAAPVLFGFSLDGNLAYYYFVLASPWCWALLLWGCCLALGQGLHRAARQPDPRREPGHRHPAATRC